jgi:hypothetical protein
MKFANAMKINRKSGVRLGEGAPVLFPGGSFVKSRIAGVGLWYPPTLRFVSGLEPGFLLAWL